MFVQNREIVWKSYNIRKGVRKRLSELAGDVDDLTCVRTEGVNCPIDIDEESRES